MLQNLHGDGVRLSLKAAISNIPSRPNTKHLKARKLSRFFTLGYKTAGAGQEIKIKIQQKTLGLDHVDEEKKESGIRYYICIDLPTAASSYFTTAADLANPVHLE